MWHALYYKKVCCAAPRIEVVTVNLARKLIVSAFLLKYEGHHLPFRLTYPRMVSSLNLKKVDMLPSSIASDADKNKANGNIAKPSKTALKYLGSPYARNAQWSCTNDDISMSCIMPYTKCLENFSYSKELRQASKNGCPSFSRKSRYSADAIHGQKSNVLFVMPGLGRKLAGAGFVNFYDGIRFVPHDVSAADWDCFMRELKITNRPTLTQEILLGVCGMPFGLFGICIGPLIRFSLQQRWEIKVFRVMEIWQMMFFEQRNLDVFLVRNGCERCTGRTPGGSIPALDGAVQGTIASLAMETCSRYGPKSPHKRVSAYVLVVKILS